MKTQRQVGQVHSATIPFLLQPVILLNTYKPLFKFSADTMVLFKAEVLPIETSTKGLFLINCFSAYHEETVCVNICIFRNPEFHWSKTRKVTDFLDKTIYFNKWMSLYDELEAATAALLGFGVVPSRNPFLQVEIQLPLFERTISAPGYFLISNV